MRAAIVLVCPGLTAGAAGAVGAVGPADPEATPAARRVLEYVQSIQGTRTLAGHHVMYGDMAVRELAFIEETTGRQPAVVEFEIGIFAEKGGPQDVEARRRLVKDAIAVWRGGGLVAMCWHWGTPARTRNSYPNTKVKFGIAAALAEGTPERAGLERDLDATAGTLAELREAGVPVLWRPLHEACGAWFWWGMEGADPARRLWRFMYDRFTRQHRLHHLIWVWSASQEQRMDWFPGAETVDVVGVDIYRAGQQGERGRYDRLAAVAGGKPVALTECDVLPDPDAMLARGFLWGWITTWHSEHVRKNRPEDLRRFYRHERVVTRDELPKFAGEEAAVRAP